MGRTGIAIQLLLCLGIALGGCTTSSESAQADDLTKHVGNYDPPPGEFDSKKKERAGVPAFLDARTGERAAVKELGAVAADQLTTLLVKSRRFDVIERAQLQQLLKEQGLQGVVDPNELAKPGKVKGVKYLLIGKVTNYRVKKEKSTTGFGFAKIASFLGLVDAKTDKTVITVDCGVDLRVVDSTDGSILAAEFGEYKKTDELKAFGLEILGADATAKEDLDISDNNHGKILRLAIDECVRKMLPALDEELIQRQGSE